MSKDYFSDEVATKDYFSEEISKPKNYFEEEVSEDKDYFSEEISAPPKAESKDFFAEEIASPEAKPGGGANLGELFLAGGKTTLDSGLIVGKGVASTFAFDLPKNIVGYVQSLVEGTQKDNVMEKFWSNERFIDAPDKFLNIPIASRKDIDKGIIDSAKKFIKWNEKTSADLFPPEKNMPHQFLRDLGSGVSSVAASVGISLVTGNPASSMALFGAIQTGSLYKEARDKGWSPAEAKAVADPGGFTELVLEGVGLHFMLGKYATPVKRLLTTTASEALQEFSQTGAEEVWAQLKGLREHEGIMAILKKSLYSGFLGALIGGGSAIALSGRDSTPLEKAKQDIKSDLLKTGIDDKTADKMADVLIKKGGEMASEISENAVNDLIPEDVTPKKKASYKQQITNIVNQGINKPDVKNLLNEKFKEKLDMIEDNKEKSEFIKESITGVNELNDYFKNRIDPTLTPEYSQKIKELPNKYKTKSGGISADRLLNEVNSEVDVGITFESVDSMLDYLIQSPSVVEDLKSQLAQAKSPIVKRRESTMLKQKLTDIKQGFLKGTIYTKQQVNKVQTQIIDVIKASRLDAKDQSKFINTIKNIQTQEQLQKKLPEIERRVSELELAETNRSTRSSIKNELKYTKPVKKGSVRVGKYDYETNKFLEKLRKYNKLTQEKAQISLDSLGEPSTEMEAIENRFLSMQANGAGASSAIHREVLKDIQRLKEEGKEAKSDSDLEKRINRAEKVEETKNAMDRMKGTKKNIRNKMVSSYINLFSPVYSIINSIAGKQLSEELDPQLAENARNTALFEKTDEINKNAAKILGIDIKKLSESLFDMSRKVFEITDVEGITRELSKFDLIDIYNSVTNDQIRKRYYDHFGEDQVNQLISPLNLTQEERNLAEYMQGVAQDYYDVFNERSIRDRGMDLGVVPNYWMATSEKPIDVFDDIKIQGERASAEKSRARGKVKPIPKNAWIKLNRHIAQAEHVRHLSQKYAQLKKLFNDRHVKAKIEAKFGEKVFTTLDMQIDEISLNKQSEKLDAMTNLIGVALNNWVTAKIAMNPSVFVKQLISVGNYMEDIDSVEWAKYFAQGVANPKKTFDYMWKIAPFLPARFNRGYSEALNRVLEDAKQIDKHKGDWSKALTALVRIGDIGAIVYGGYPIIKSEMAKHGDIKKAVKKFELTTLKAQQSGLATSRSQFQNMKNPLARLFLAFKNTANQYFRKQIDAIISHANGDISSKQLAKTLTIYGVIQPALYGTASIAMSALLYGTVDDEEDILRKLLGYLVTNPFQAIPVVDQLANAAYRKMTGQRVWGSFNLPMVSEVFMAFLNLGKNDITIFEVLESLAVFGEVGTGLPLKLPAKIFERIFGVEDGDSLPTLSGLPTISLK